LVVLLEDNTTVRTASARRSSAIRILYGIPHKGRYFMARKRAFVTGASRGIGKAIAIKLAQAGYDVAITARTVEEGEEREHSSTVKKSDTSPLPGSLSTTADVMRAAGAEVMVLPADLTERATLGAAATAVLERWGGVDLVVHNARFIGPGHMDILLDVPVEVLEKHVQGNAFAPLILNRYFLPPMIAQGGGTIIYITSTAAYEAPTKMAGKGGWGMCYAMSKHAGHAMAGVLDVEYRDKGVRSFNLQPGAIKTERLIQDMTAFGFDASGWTPPEVIGEVVNWLVTSPDADAYLGKTIQGQELCDELGLLPGWSLKRPVTA
jgi:NAD(P)-dependent dehydrogenase (short-subunit alcohol dehydrogenase family)